MKRREFIKMVGMGATLLPMSTTIFARILSTSAAGSPSNRGRRENRRAAPELPDADHAYAKASPARAGPEYGFLRYTQYPSE